MLSQPPAILHAIDTTGPGGAETVFLQLVEQLKFPGVNNFAIIKGPGWVEDQLKLREIPYQIIKPHGFFSIPYYWQLIQILRHRNVKLIQANLLGSTLTYSIISLILRIPLVATLHGKVDINPNERFVNIKNWIMRLGVNQLIAVSQDLADYIAARKLFDKRLITVVYNGISNLAYGKSTHTELRRELGFDEQAILIGSVGNVRPAKAYEVLIDAAKIVVTKWPNAKFVIAGDRKPTLMVELNKQIEQLNLSKYVHFIGFCNDSASFLGQLDLFALSSSSEGFSIATIEALATGLPVVATRSGGPEEILVHNKTGVLVPTSEPQALAEALLELIADPDRARALAQAGKDATAARFSADIMLKRYRQLYQQLRPTLMSN